MNSISTPVVLIMHSQSELERKICPLRSGREAVRNGGGAAAARGALFFCVLLRKKVVASVRPGLLTSKTSATSYMYRPMYY